MIWTIGYFNMRAFIALELPQEIKTYLYSIGQLIKNQCSGTCSKEENLHLTLAFLGDISQNQKEILINTMSTYLKNKPSTLTLDKLVFFGSPQSATVYCSLKRSNELLSLVSQVNNCVKNAKIPLDERPFKAHLTLGRKVNFSQFRLNSVAINQIEFRPESITLFKSTLTPQGPIYEAIKKV